MTSGDQIWRATAAIVSTVVLSVLVAAWGPVSVVGLWFLGFGIAYAAVVVVTMNEPATQTSTWAGIPVAAGVGAMIEAGIALSTYDAWIGLLVTSALTVTSPPVRRRLHGPEPVPSAPPPAPSPDLAEYLPLGTAPGLIAHVLCTSPTEFGDEELAWAWRLSYVLLQYADHPDQRASVTRLRQGYLDEMERRYPAGLAAWLESGARAASDPTRYLRRDPAQ